MQPTKPIAETIGEESKPEPGAKRPPKTAQPELDKLLSKPEGASGRLKKRFIEAEGGPVKYPGQGLPNYLDIDRVFKALADPTRRRLLDLLRRENGQTLSALCEHMDMTRQGVTQHLQLLEEANLVAVVWQGREKLHYLNPVPLHDIYERWIGKFEHSRLGAMRDLKNRLEGDDDDKA